MAPPPGPRPRRRGRRPGDRGPPWVGPGSAGRARRPWPWPRSGWRRSSARPRAAPDHVPRHRALAGAAQASRRPRPSRGHGRGPTPRRAPTRAPMVHPPPAACTGTRAGGPSGARGASLRCHPTAARRRRRPARQGPPRRACRPGAAPRSARWRAPRTTVGRLPVGTPAPPARCGNPTATARRGWRALSTRSGSPPKRHRAATPTRRARRRTLGAVSAASTTSRSLVGPPSRSAMATIAATRARSALRSSATARSPAGRPLRSRRRSRRMPGRFASHVRTRTRKAMATITRANSWEATSSRAASSSSGSEAAGSTSTTAVRIEPAHTVATTQSVPHLVHAATASRATAMKAKASGVLTSNRPRPGNRRFRTTAVAGSPRSSRPRATMSSTTKQAASTPATARRRRTAAGSATVPSARCARRSSTTPATTRPARGTRTATRSSQPLPWARRSVGAVTAAQSWTGNPRAGRAAARPPVADHA